MTFLSIIIILIILIIISIYLYLKVKEIYKHFKKTDVRYVEPMLLFGNRAPALLKRKHMVNIIKDMGNRFAGEKYFGFFDLMRPVLIIQDADLIKQIGVKQFDNFMNRSDHECIQPDFFTLIPFLKDDDWRKIRPPTTMFLSVNRIKEFYPILMNHVGFVINHYEKLLQDRVSLKGIMVYEEETAKLAKCFVASSIVSITFAEDVNPFEDKHNDLLQTCIKYIDFDFTKTLKAIGWDLLPGLMRVFKISVFPKQDTFFLLQTFSKALKEREIFQTDRPDVCQAFQDIKRKYQKTAISEPNGSNKFDAEAQDLLLYQILIILVGGLDSTAGSISTVLYELTKNENIQNRLRSEITEVIKLYGSNPSWEVINQMKYLEMVICESIRVWPQTLEVLHRVCNRDTKIEPPREGGKPYMIHKGDNVWLSVVGVHFNEKYWKNPNIFDPERFSEENRLKIQPLSYIPFGVGPRTCIAYRFALMLIKSMTFHFIAKFELKKTEKFNENLTHNASSYSLQAERNWTGISLRK